MDLLDLSLTEESSISTKGEMSFTLYANTNMADTRIMYCCFEPRMSDFGTRGPGLIPGRTLITFFFLFSPCNAKLLHTRNVELYK